MFTTRFAMQKTAAFVGMWLVIAVSCGAQSAAVPEKDAPKTPGVLELHYIKTGLFYFTGGGGNSVLRLSGEGLLLVDGKRAENYDELRLRMKKASNQVVRLVVNTDHYEEHAGTNARFIADKVPVLGQTNAPRNLASYHATGEPIAPPSNTYETNQTLHLGPVQAQVLHFGSGRTSEDTVVYFPDKRAVALGDLYAPVAEPDYASGGSLVDWSASLGEVLKLDFDIAIPGDGPAVPRADVELLKKKIDDVVARASALVKAGVKRDEFMARLKTDDPEWKANFSPEQVDGFYAELAAGAGASPAKSEGASLKTNPPTQ